MLYTVYCMSSAKLSSYCILYTVPSTVHCVSCINLRICDVLSSLLSSHLSRLSFSLLLSLLSRLIYEAAIKSRRPRHNFAQVLPLFVIFLEAQIYESVIFSRLSSLFSPLASLGFSSLFCDQESPCKASICTSIAFLYLF